MATKRPRTALCLRVRKGEEEERGEENSEEDASVCVCVCVCMCVCVSHLAVSDSVKPWTVVCQASLSMKFSRQEHCSGLSLPSPGALPNPGIQLPSPAFQADCLPSEPPGKPKDTAIIK